MLWASHLPAFHFHDTLARSFSGPFCFTRLSGLIFLLGGKEIARTTLKEQTVLTAPSCLRSQGDLIRAINSRDETDVS